MSHVFFTHVEYTQRMPDNIANANSICIFQQEVNHQSQKNIKKNLVVHATMHSIDMCGTLGTDKSKPLTIIYKIQYFHMVVHWFWTNHLSIFYLNLSLHVGNLQSVYRRPKQANRSMSECRPNLDAQGQLTKEKRVMVGVQCMFIGINVLQLLPAIIVYNFLHNFGHPMPHAVDPSLVWVAGNKRTFFDCRRRKFGCA